MNRFSLLPAYMVGFPLVFTGLFALRNPLAAHSLFGVPSPSPPATTTKISPFVYAKAVRDVALGLTCLGLQSQGNENGVTAILAGAMFVGLGDGWIVWCFGGEELRRKAWGHWVPTVVVLAPLVVIRLLAD
ncbi:hypothetical protein G7Z17_g3570 [Cylindrodendrum hubeiense]|uniref:Uncharacterized protein n=1 Tax=Cylindrodendrum hubeiense TaxID=595255 RepID=A0A9P5LJ87_9HYPO|nr:hypothetical protein G7Z17_g3570 [Cylindrodendrum hubeiense]